MYALNEITCWSLYMLQCTDEWHYATHFISASNLTIGDQASYCLHNIYASTNRRLTIRDEGISLPEQCDRKLSNARVQTYRRLLLLLGRTSYGWGISINLLCGGDGSLLLVKLPLAMGQSLETRQSVGRRSSSELW